MISGFSSPLLLLLEEAKDKSSYSGWKFTFGASKYDWDHVRGQERLGSQSTLTVPECPQGLVPHLSILTEGSCTDDPGA